MGFDERPPVYQWAASNDPSRRHGWGNRLGLLVGGLILVGWPLLWTLQSRPGDHRWLYGMAIPWWIVVAGAGLTVMIAKVLNRGS
jgi:hypothetical protein